jgi:nitroreductase
MATLAASSHNSQPWYFTVKENVIRIHPDKNRALPVVDPFDRELYISLGCALENMAIAAAQAGLTAQTDLFPQNENDTLRVTLTSSQNASETALFNAIPMRQCTRGLYNQQNVPAADRNKLESIELQKGVSMQILDTPSQIDALVNLIIAGNQVQYSDREYIDELIGWLRFNEAEAVETMDGLFSRCSGNPTVPRFLGKMFVASSKPESVSKTDEEKIRSSAGMVSIATEMDSPQDWVNAGRAVQRFALTATSLGIKVVFLNQPIEVPEVRAQLANTLDQASYPQLLLRFGYSDPMPVSLRRPVESVIL